MKGLYKLNRNRNVTNALQRGLTKVPWTQTAYPFGEWEASGLLQVEGPRSWHSREREVPEKTPQDQSLVHICGSGEKVGLRKGWKERWWQVLDASPMLG